jgi:hypothetical protein
MARIGMEGFRDGTEIVRVYLAARLEEAQAVERALDEAGVSYGVEVEEFVAPTALGSSAPRRGVGFWVDADALAAGADALQRAGLLAGLVER